LAETFLQARIEAQSHRLTVEDAPSVEYMARFVATIQQTYTQRGGRRPFGISMLICGHDPDGTPRLFQTDPAGTYSAWKANAIGRNAKTLREFLEARYTDAMEDTDGVMLAVRALLEVVESGAKSIEIAILRAAAKPEMVPASAVEAVVAAIEAEAEPEGDAGADTDAPGASASASSSSS
jgi:20S proteasome subunit alpha 4